MTPVRRYAPLRVLELFCGLGGCAAALLGREAEIVQAIDIKREALAIYRENFPHPTSVREIESLSADDLGEWRADLWWLSPPCQPYTVRGARRDLADPRSRSLLTIIVHIERVRPRFVALENVAGFQSSAARLRLLSALRRAGYQVAERILCPTELGPSIGALVIIC